MFTHFFSLKPFKHKICFPLKPKIYFPDRVSILVHFRFFAFQVVNLLSSGNRESVSVEPCVLGKMSLFLAVKVSFRIAHEEITKKKEF